MKGKVIYYPSQCGYRQDAVMGHICGLKMISSCPNISCISANHFLEDCPLHNGTSDIDYAMFLNKILSEIKRECEKIANDNKTEEIENCDIRPLV